MLLMLQYTDVKTFVHKLSEGCCVMCVCCVAVNTTACKRSEKEKGNKSSDTME